MSTSLPLTCQAFLAIPLLIVLPSISYGQTERSSKTQTAERPNILWISAEDLSPDLGCYGDQNAITPTLDRLAKEGVRFTRCFTHAAVCAPSRSGLITGCYPNSIGTHHMRCQGIPPENVKCFSEYLRLAGYYCTNNVKTDYQFAPPSTAWDESSSRADWRNRPRTESADGKISSPPFFCVINLLTTHEGQIRDPSKQTKSLVASLPPANRHDTSKLIVPPFYPDLPAGERSVSEIPSKLVTLSGRLAANRVRCDLANYYDNVTAMDGQVSEILQRLDEDGLSENTIVWFWGDHGRGMPRYKRWLYDTGTHVPLLIRVPSKWRNFVAPNDPESMKPGTVNSDLVAFVDFAPTILSLAGIKPKPHFQGQAFLGPFQSDKKRKYVYGHRDRMDETYDLIRTIRDHRYRYVRNFMPWQPYSQDITYMNNMPTMKEWRELAALGKLSGPAADWFRPVKPNEELYDTESDPYEIHNRIDDPELRLTRERLRKELDVWMNEIGDVGMMPEPILDELQSRAGHSDLQVAAPGVTNDAVDQDGSRTIVRLNVDDMISSIAYRIRSDQADTKPENSPWQVVVNGQIIVIGKGQILEAKANRLGYVESSIVRFQPGQSDKSPQKNKMPDHWKSRETERIQNVRTYVEGHSLERPILLQDATLPPEILFWRATWLGREGGLNMSNPNREASIAVLRQMFEPANHTAVRIVAARWLCEVDSSDKYLPSIVECLEHTSPSIQLQAITALYELKDKARPAIENIREATKKSEYVARVAKRAMSQWEPESVRERSSDK